MDDITKCYEILGLKPGASFEAVKEAYRDLVKVWHPDRFAHDPKLQVKSQEKLKEINEAFQKIQEFLNHLHTYQQATGDRQEYSKEEQYSKAEESTQEDTKQSTESKGREYHNSSQEPPKEPPKTPREERSAYQKDYQEPRPWVRFWARTLDLILLGFPAGFMFWFLFPEFTTRVTKAGGPFVIGFFILPFVVIMEAIIITIFGNTPAKAILKTKITNSEGKSLSFAEALKRSFYIYFAGYAIGIPLIPLATYYWQYRKLQEDGKTSWDNKLDINIVHSHIGGVRITSYVGLYLISILILGVASSQQGANIRESWKSIRNDMASITLAPSPAPGLKDYYLAKVGKAVITQADFERESKNLPDFAQKMFESNSGKEKFLDELVKKEILYQEAVKKGFDKDSGYLKKVEDFKKITLVGILLEKEIEAKATVSEKDIKDYYENHKEDFTPVSQIRASHILVKTEQEAKDIAERLKKGEDFAKIANKSSIDTVSAKNGGDLGFISKGQMVPEFESAAVKLKKGEISELVHTQFGYHIIKVTDKKLGQAIEFDKVKNIISQHLVAEKQKQFFDSYMDALRKNYKVEF